MPVSRTAKHKKRKKGPDLTAPVSVLSPEQPLECCVINNDWRDAHMANIIIARKAAGRFTVVGFLVDIWGLGLKDALLHKGLSRMELDKFVLIADRDSELVDCPLSLAQQLVYGGLAWARQHGFRIPAEAIRCLKILPAPSEDPDLSCFGTEDGSPMIIGDML